MKALESQATVQKDGTLSLPPAVSNVLPRGGRVRVIVLVDEPSAADDEAWSAAAGGAFVADDDGADDRYDRL